ncbi:cytochrome P450 4g15-like [Trichoplusia ni]|uniref:Cytochrome P450 4g15-like n=1 Tax=Trichoplusia ni TaxID=7111 RepID=A0A7E5VNW6_TRINI|nr:cytochrome P450 4g15-like [Trichoplusia ni]
MAIYLGPRAYTIISDPDAAQIVSRHCLEKHYIYEIAKPWLGNGLLTADIPTWKRNRKIMNLAFTQQVLNGFISVFNTQSRRLAKQFEDNPERTFEPHTMLLTNNLETICSESCFVHFLTRLPLYI